MATIQKFEDLEIWKEAVKLGVTVYKLTNKAPLSIDFSAKDQLRRAAISVSNNIAEGFEYNNNKVFVKFLMYSKGSAGEVRSQLFVLKEAEVISQKVFEPIYNDLLKLSKGIEGFRKYLKKFEGNKPNSTKSKPSNL